MPRAHLPQPSWVPIVDERRCIPCTRVAWGDTRRHDYLLRTIPDIPLSVDRQAFVPSSGCAHEARVRLVGYALPSDEPTSRLAEGRRLHDLDPPEGAAFVGYDVAGPTTSAVCNIRFGGAQERTRLRKRWGPLLNDHHLFDDADDARAFAQLVARRIPEHAPFLAIAVSMALVPCPEG
ncbi:MAG: hypothetical protein U0183_16230 [Polyangiaceae bacterium]